MPHARRSASTPDGVTDPSRHRAPRRRELDLSQYEAGVRSRDIAILARALTLIESNNPHHEQLAEQLLARLAPLASGSIRVGITGAPGAGKSTFIESLGLKLVRSGTRVAVLAVDPSSSVSGGSILGDKTRMAGLAAEPDAYIRPSPSAGTLGGVARKTRESLLICEAAGYDVLLVETVGVGQSETMVADMTDCFLALMLPGAGDELQGIKRGLLELVDVVAVNKADGANRVPAELAAQAYALALKTLAGRHADEAPAVLTCSALHGYGIDEVWRAIHQHFSQLQAGGALQQRRQRQNLRWLWNAVDERLRHMVRANAAVQAICRQLEQQVLSGILTPEAAARQILDAFHRSSTGGSAQ